MRTTGMRPSLTRRYTFASLIRRYSATSWTVMIVKLSLVDSACSGIGCLYSSRCWIRCLSMDRPDKTKYDFKNVRIVMLHSNGDEYMTVRSKKEHCYFVAERKGQGASWQANPSGGYPDGFLVSVRVSDTT